MRKSSIGEVDESAASMGCGFTYLTVDRHGSLPSSLELRRCPVGSVDEGVDSCAPGSSAGRHGCVQYAYLSLAGVSWTLTCTWTSPRPTPRRFFEWTSGWHGPSSAGFPG